MYNEFLTFEETSRLIIIRKKNLFTHIAAASDVFQRKFLMTPQVDIINNARSMLRVCHIQFCV